MHLFLPSPLTYVDFEMFSVGRDGKVASWQQAVHNRSRRNCSQWGAWRIRTWQARSLSMTCVYVPIIIPLLSGLLPHALAFAPSSLPYCSCNTRASPKQNLTAFYSRRLFKILWFMPQFISGFFFQFLLSVCSHTIIHPSSHHCTTRVGNKCVDS